MHCSGDGGQGMAAAMWPESERRKVGGLRKVVQKYYQVGGMEKQNCVHFRPFELFNGNLLRCAGHSTRGKDKSHFAEV